MSSQGVSIRSYRDLRVWQLGIQLTREAYALASTLPRAERFGLAPQMCRAAVSIPSNIAEGHARGATRDFSRFVSIALGSIAELETQVEVSLQLGYLDTASAQPMLSTCEELGRALVALRKSLDTKLSRARAGAP